MDGACGGGGGGGPRRPHLGRARVAVSEVLHDDAVEDEVAVPRQRAGRDDQLASGRAGADGGGVEGDRHPIGWSDQLLQPLVPWSRARRGGLLPQWVHRAPAQARRSRGRDNEPRASQRGRAAPRRAAPPSPGARPATAGFAAHLVDLHPKVHGRLCARHSDDHQRPKDVDAGLESCVRCVCPRAHVCAFVCVCVCMRACVRAAFARRARAAAARGADGAGGRPRRRGSRPARRAPAGPAACAA
jgi:hypothetical protein